MRNTEARKQILKAAPSGEDHSGLSWMTEFGNVGIESRLGNVGIEGIGGIENLGMFGSLGMVGIGGGAAGFGRIRHVWDR
ncbi:hypothetical protein LIER_42975 [Lithospermum erythrorhizon]|uniref:Uncharacterized protein n=1 Tax=Lithospermum erythrorhizon TaxID=34254 RepID=A0AAV3P8G6_LITER